MFKIIEDPKYHYKWVVPQQGIKDKYYKGLIGWELLFQNDKPIVRGYNLTILKKLFDGKLTLAKREYDIVRPLTLKEYVLLGNFFKLNKLQYNKKNNQVITCTN